MLQAKFNKMGVGHNKVAKCYFVRICCFFHIKSTFSKELYQKRESFDQLSLKWGALSKGY